MDNETLKSPQVDAEQRAVDGMYAQLESELNKSLSAHTRALASPVDGPGDLYARDLEVSRHAEKARQLRAAEQSLCFGRIDGDFEASSLHIGRLGLRNDAGELVLVDWRAEAARPFYSATLATPLGVRRRRHLRLDGRRVCDVNDEILDGTAPHADDAVGDGPLVAALSGARTGRMKEAAATLQAEQDEIVRSQHIGITVVEGGPGTGKTIVALHRAAYVLYDFPAVAARGVLIFGPNQRFLAYISDVLPSLGENDVQLSTTADLVDAEALRPEADAVARIKGRGLFATGIARWVQSHSPHGIPLTVPTPHDIVTLAPGVVDAARRSALQGGVGHNSARELFTEYIVDELINEIEQRTAQEQEESEQALEAQLGKALSQIAGPSTGSTDDLEIDWERIRDELLEDRGVARAIAKVWPLLEPDSALRELLSDRQALAEMLPELRADEIELLTETDRDERWSDADLPLLDEARSLVDGSPETLYGHIVIDEAQQLTEMQWRMLMRRCPSRSMTVVGDLAQAGPITTVRSWGDALSPFVEDRYVQHNLTVNYRTTAEILTETRPLLAKIAPNQKLARSIRNGEAPLTIPVAEQDCWTTLRELIEITSTEHPDELIGVVASTARTAALEKDVGSTGATIIAAPEARGLEFDTVIIVDPAGIQSASEAGIRDLYVAQTRATKRLITLEIASA